MDYERKVAVRFYIWCGWWSVLILAVAGWVIDFFTGLHPMPMLLAFYVVASITILLHNIPSKNKLVNKDLNRHEFSDYARVYLLKNELKKESDDVNVKKLGDSLELKLNKLKRSKDDVHEED